ncbi:lamin tail domain-containing protein [Salinibacterium sp. ZJ450]|uniref:lamin tail domain-containing protein n=1 Tax=Salinibacterium sp. ZJ450 TaxID=2708338 RepID=UPI0014234DC6|nr:lamin tail domain-containing protein [Salinibacterium sp. ZJ450]
MTLTSRLHCRGALATLAALATTIPLLAAVPALAAEPPTTPVLPTVSINEVESDGDPDWIELVNTGAAPVDISGWAVKDDKDERTSTIPADTVLAPDGYYVIEEPVIDFGLGKEDTARVFLADGVTLVDSFAWTGHAVTSYGRCDDGTGTFGLTAVETKGLANDCEIPASAALLINEVESNGDAAGDWVELVNTSFLPVDASNLVLRDNKDASSLVIPAGTSIAAGGLFSILTEPAFGLGGEDSVRLFDTDGVTIIDQHSWATHATTSYGRCPGIDGFTETSAVTRDAVNECAAPTGADIIINEVESNGGTPGDWIELVNPTAAAVDLSGWIVRDNDDTRGATLPDGSVIAAGGYFVVEEATLGFGLGKADMARLYLSDGVTLIASAEWADHAATTFGRCADITGDFVTTTSSTKGAPNDCGLPVRINEVESSGDADDWVELVNNGAGAADVAGYVFKDSDDTHAYVLPAGTTIAAGGHLLITEAAFSFGLGKGDSARLFAPDGSLVDSYAWAAHSTTTYGRCADGTGAFADTREPTPGAVNACVGDVITSAWPGSADVATADLLDTFDGNMSGLVFEPASSGSAGSDVLWAVRNGVGTLFRLVQDGGQWVPDSGAEFGGNWLTGKVLHYADGTGDVDAEGVTVTAAGAAGGVYVASERDNDGSGSRPSVLRYELGASATSLSAVTEWNLVADLPALGSNAGLEGIAWIPDADVVAAGLVDQATGVAYDPAAYPAHGGGLFFVGVEANGMVYGYALMDDGSYQRVTEFASGFPGVMEVTFDAERDQLWVVCDDTCDGRTSVFEVAASGLFESITVYERPANMPNLNNEGFAIAPQASCVAGSKQVVYADDNNTDGHALRVGTIDCVESTNPTDPTDPTNPTVPTDPADPTDPTIPGLPAPGLPGTPAAPAAPNPNELTSATRGAISVPDLLHIGGTVTITVGKELAGQRVDLWLFSTPTHLGQEIVNAAGQVSVRIPTSVSAGEHHLAVVDANGQVIAWAPVTVAAAASPAVLPRTGGEPLGFLVGASGMLLAGGLLMMLRRRAATDG